MQYGITQFFYYRNTFFCLFLKTILQFNGINEKSKNVFTNWRKSLKKYIFACDLTYFFECWLNEIKKSVKQ